ncbi:hypothetical protein [Rhizobium leguminosarum]|uniref:hypothetical protein n=1 Tax=Rhizobium leguminosarum TaxID=384 RepID=UPI000462530D|nr:hypothetical protein [Rhizobium leguminosarum]ASS55880.1 hypothetical protein CHR56_15630 [Rhizobium leguminosarum bv. viciae]
MSYSNLSDFDLASLLHETMERHDRLIDSAPMGDERIYFANKKCDEISAEQRRRGYEACPKCFDFGDIEDDETGHYCDCVMGDRLKEKRSRRRG